MRVVFHSQSDIRGVGRRSDWISIPMMTKSSGSLMFTPPRDIDNAILLVRLCVKKQYWYRLLNIKLIFSKNDVKLLDFWKVKRND